MTTDKALLRNRFAANLKSYNSLAVVQEKICAELSEMIEMSCKSTSSLLFSSSSSTCLPFSPKKIMEIGAGTGFLSRELLKLYPTANFTINDIVKEAEMYITPSFGDKTVNFICGDAENIELPLGLDLLASASTIQWFDNIPLFISRAHKALNDGGYLAFSTFGPHNFNEIKTTTKQGLTYYTSEKFSEILHQNHLKIVESIEYTKTLFFDSPTDVLRHIKATGVNSIKQVRWSKHDLEHFEKEYRSQFSNNNGKVSLTYHPLLIIARNIGSK